MDKWKVVVEAVINMGFVPNKEIEKYELVEYRHANFPGLIVKSYEGHIHCGTCFNMFKSSFESLVSYQGKIANVDERVVEIYATQYPIVRNVAKVINDAWSAPESNNV